MIQTMIKRISLYAFLFLTVAFVFRVYSTQSEKPVVDVVIFSFDRPLQLYALLESMQQHMHGMGEQHVIYRASDADFEKGYQIVGESFPEIQLHKQGANPRADFKPLTVSATFDSSSDYVIYAVDDIVVKDRVDLSECAHALGRYNAYGLYLRLGKNLTQCYSWGSRSQPLPPLQQESDELFSWQFSKGQFDWGYPHTVDMTIYRKKDIEQDVKTMGYAAPNSFEDMWNRKARAIIAQRGLCYEQSKIVNMPLNRVQHEYSNRAMSEYTPRDLLTLFLDGKKMDIAPLKCIDNKAAHMEYSPTFITR